MSHTPQTWIAHVDLDAFFASCEQRDHPEYRGLPVMVGALPGNRGVVAAASYEARSFGVHSAMPVSEAYRRCPHGVYLRPDIARYREASRQVFAALESVAPIIEKASVDEAYIDISGLQRLMGTPQDIGTAIKQCIHTATGLTASVGIGPNRLIAKLGSDYAKPDGLTVVTPAQVLDFLGPMPVANLRGNGRVTQQRFAQMGITTIEQVRTADPDWLAAQLGASLAASFQRQANGIASASVAPNRGRKSISKERTFQADQSSPEFLHDQLLELSQTLAATARKEGLAGRVVKLKLRYSNFETLTRQQTLREATQDERVLLNTAWQLFRASSPGDKAIRLIGIGLSDWAENGATQPDLFAADEPHSNPQLLKTLDEVTARFGNGKLKKGLSRQP